MPNLGCLSRDCHFHSADTIGVPITVLKKGKKT